jgi:plastocyanin
MSVSVFRTRLSLTLAILTIMSCLVACDTQKGREVSAPPQPSRPSSSSSAQSASREVVIREMKYQPADLTVHVGETVVWKNEDIFAHTVFATDQSFESGTIEPGASWTYIAKTAGVHPYYCKPHPNMKARLVVE